MKRLAIIPARGGSKRIPKKNIKDFLGKPIIAYSIETAISSSLFDEIMVSTDDLEIAEVAKRYGASVPFMRSSKNSNDFAGIFDVIKEVNDTYVSTSIHFDEICCILATAPFVNEEMIRNALELLTTNHFDCTFPIVRYSYPIQRSLKLTNGKVEMIWPENLTKRSQDLAPSFHDSGLFYWVSKELVTKGTSLWTDRTGGIEIPETHAQDIDTNEDWNIAELKYKHLNA